MIFAGVDIGGTNIKIGVVDEQGNIVASDLFPTNVKGGYEAIINDINTNLRALCLNDGIAFESLKGIGIGIPGIGDTATGRVVVCANLGDDWADRDLCNDLEKLTGLTCKVSNDANCAALGEQKFGSAKKYSDVVFITIGTGIGSGIIINNKLFTGIGSVGAEAGHMTLVMDGIPCNCGGKGCWEKYASATALVNQTIEASKKYPDSLLAQMIEKDGEVCGKTPFDAKKQGCPVAKAVIDQYIKYFAEGLKSLANVLHPQAFIVGGGVSHQGDALMQPVEDVLNDYLTRSKFLPKIDVIPASLGNSAGLLGAAALVL